MEESPWDINSKSSYLNIDGPIVDYIGPNDYKVVTLVRAKDRISSQNGIFYFEVKIINVGNNGIIGIGFCAKPNMTIYDSNMLMPGQSSNSCSYHSDDGYSFCFGKSRPYGPIYTSGDTIGCYLNFRKNEVFFTKNGINLGVIEFHLHGSKYDLYPCVGLRSQGGSITINFRNSGDFEYSVMNNDDVDGILWGKNCLEFLIDNELDQFLENYPNNAFALMYRGISYLMMNMYEEALEDFAKVLEILPDDSLALSYRGKTNFIKGKHEPALEDFSKALENEPNNVHALKFRGKYYFIRGEYDKAFEDLTKLLEIEPNNAIALRYRAEIYMLDEKYYESSADLKELLKINPDNKWTQEANNFVDEIFWDSTADAFRSDRPDFTMDLFETLAWKWERNQELDWDFEKSSKDALANIQKQIIDMGFADGIFLSSNRSVPFPSLNAENLLELKKTIRSVGVSLKELLPRSSKRLTDNRENRDRIREEGKPFYFSRILIFYGICEYLDLVTRQIH